LEPPRPKTIRGWNERGWSYFNLGRYDDASQGFQAIYKANRSPDALSRLTAIRDVTQRNRY